MKRPIFFLLSVIILVTFIAVLPAAAHQPFFEEEDIEFNAPWVIEDPRISTVVYATLESQRDVDYFAFEGKAGQVIQLGMVIPQIEGQDDFAPIMALLGPGLADADLPARVQRPGGGALVFAPEPGPASTFYEPFSGTSYWERQEVRISLQESGRYMVAVWHPDGRPGRYAFVIGDKERLGGDLLGLISKMRRYWTPVAAPAASDGEHHCGLSRE
jgi:hypothetical protein